MDTAEQDVVGLVEYAGGRLTDRMEGLSDDEWAWQPITGDAEVTVRWRLDHVVEVLTTSRNREWLGLAPSTGPTPGTPATAAEALAGLDAAIRVFLAAATEVGDTASEPMGAVAGPYAESTKRSFVLHVADELIHHGAEAALLRDLYAARPSRSSRTTETASVASDAG
ncbi:DinB family protein [Curtobacterium sp. 458]|uniref:DinB family protein n=1 Tax=Curtobacterium sp. 458 TaxID=3050069 RepID=UPI0025B52F89|nr:DinB family protein [Curtobacterium sp. 458]WJY00997.1 DinB family protein [Curtobacterium sp. 458]